MDNIKSKKIIYDISLSLYLYNFFISYIEL